MGKHLVKSSPVPFLGKDEQIKCIKYTEICGHPKIEDESFSKSGEDFSKSQPRLSERNRSKTDPQHGRDTDEEKDKGI
ncbi:hypothetical protein GCM10022289_01130 [Pedobacter jeongneungensis]|uniref:Uncharacterized protein n=1 Tax=Pedobacter jeongneungensis TaxID=947309 RepID=A0ABP8B2W9_9SPHI